MLSWRRIARRAAAGLGPREGARLLHVSDIHNSVRGFRFASALAGVLEPDLVVSTGDLSGTGGFPETVLLRALWRIRGPQVLAPGNHDSPATHRALRRMGAAVLDRPTLVEVAGIRVWGFPDPNRSPLFGPPYNLALTRQAARASPPPEGTGPYLIAVHDNAMVERPPPEAIMVLSGHAHVPKLQRRGHAVLLRCGSTGGGGPFGGPLQAAVVDLALPDHRPLHLWLIETDGRHLSVTPAALDAPLPVEDAEDVVEEQARGDREQQ